VPLAFWAHDAWSGRHWTEQWARRTPPDLVIANSRFTASTLDEAYASVPREVIYAPVDAAADTTAAERTAIRRELATSASAVVVAQASRMEPWKGHATLLQALASHREDPRWHCWMIGGAQRPTERAYLESLQRRAAALGVDRRVSFCGERTDVRRLLAAADVYCQPNVRPEPFGIVFVEALAAGLPVAAAASGGALEIVDHSCGRLVPPGDADGWRATVGELIADAALRARLGASARGRAADLCDPASQRRHLDRALETICAVSR
jgi:glycosyltransferase involved in cell wall biosynthesis